jgi:hypothetical protein
MIIASVVHVVILAKAMVIAKELAA